MLWHAKGWRGVRCLRLVTNHICQLHPQKFKAALKERLEEIIGCFPLPMGGTGVAVCCMQGAHRAPTGAMLLLMCSRISCRTALEHCYRVRKAVDLWSKHERHPVMQYVLPHHERHCLELAEELRLYSTLPAVVDWDSFEEVFVGQPIVQAVMPRRASSARPLSKGPLGRLPSPAAQAPTTWSANKFTPQAAAPKAPPAGLRRRSDTPPPAAMVAAAKAAAAKAAAKAAAPAAKAAAPAAKPAAPQWMAGDWSCPHCIEPVRKPAVECPKCGRAKPSILEPGVHVAPATAMAVAQKAPPTAMAVAQKAPPTASDPAPAAARAAAVGDPLQQVVQVQALAAAAPPAKAAAALAAAAAPVGDLIRSQAALVGDPIQSQADMFAEIRRQQADMFAEMSRSMKELTAQNKALTQQVRAR